MLHIHVDTSLLTGAENITAGVGNSSAEDPRSGRTGPTDQSMRRYLAVTYLQSNVMPAERMGVAHLACVQGCRCKRVQLAFRGEVSTGIAATEVSPWPVVQCCNSISTRNMAS
jgi:hypothetical protein